MNAICIFFSPYTAQFFFNGFHIKDSKFHLLNNVPIETTPNKYFKYKKKVPSRLKKIGSTFFLYIIFTLRFMPWNKSSFTWIVNNASLSFYIAVNIVNCFHRERSESFSQSLVNNELHRPSMPPSCL